MWMLVVTVVLVGSNAGTYTKHFPGYRDGDACYAAMAATVQRRNDLLARTLPRGVKLKKVERTMAIDLSCRQPPKVGIAI